MQNLVGTGVALVTPFDKNNKVDTIGLTNLVDFVIHNGVNYLVILGTTAEPATLTLEEKEIVIQTIIAANNNRLPLVLGLGGNNTEQVVQEIKNTNLSPFSAILSVSPYYNKPTQDGIYQHFEQIALHCPIPIILYNVPGRTASNMLPETVVKLATNFKNIIAVKEAAGDMIQAMKLIQLKPKDFLIISGDDMLALPIILAGGVGVISVIGQGFPAQFSKMIQLGLQKKAEEAYTLHYQLADSIDLIFEQGNPAGIKEVLKHLGVIQNSVRLPLVTVDAVLSQKILEFCNQMASFK
jgi:4-hydroxy-tetrahydrodipicolinate synthase